MARHRAPDDGSISASDVTSDLRDIGELSTDYMDCRLESKHGVIGSAGGSGDAWSGRAWVDLRIRVVHDFNQQLDEKGIPVAITLYYAPRTRAARVAFLLEELGVPYDRKVLDLFTDKTKSGGHIIFYTKSMGAEKTAAILPVWEKEKPVERVGEFKTLLIYRKK